MAARTARGFKKLVRTWLIKIVEGRYRCWDDFLFYGMASAGHSDPPGAPMKLLSVGDEVYAFLNTRGYVGRGKVTKAASLADQFVVDGNFIAIDGSGSFNQVKLTDILLLGMGRRREVAQQLLPEKAETFRRNAGAVEYGGRTHRCGDKKVLGVGVQRATEQWRSPES